MLRNPLEIIRHYIGFFEDSLKLKKQVNPDTKMILECKIDLLKTLESDMEIEYFPLGDKTTLHELRKGAVFATEDGIYAVKSEYRYSDGQWQCILLESGEYAHFRDGNHTVVYEVIQSRQQKEE